jgi:hypothetical protein
VLSIPKQVAGPGDLAFPEKRSKVYTSPYNTMGWDDVRKKALHPYLSTAARGLVPVTPHVMKTLIKFLKPQLIPKWRANQVIEVQNQKSNEKSEVQTPAMMVLMAQSRNFGKFINLIFTLIPKHHLILMIFTTITKIHKKFQSR